MTPLIAHPQHPPAHALALSANAVFANGGAQFEFELRGAACVLWPAPVAPERADLLWKTTCFEAFLQPEDQAGYIEFNFSPSGRWAAYGFESFRVGMRHAAMAQAPIITFVSDGDRATLSAAVPVLPVDLDGVTRLKLGLTAVIESVDGALSYHALTHPSPDPNFHNASGFTLDVILT
jgi:hypothetical protein